MPDAPEHQEGDTVDDFLLWPVSFNNSGLYLLRRSGPSDHRMSQDRVCTKAEDECEKGLHSSRRTRLLINLQKNIQTADFLAIKFLKRLFRYMYYVYQPW